MLSVKRALYVFSVGIFLGIVFYAAHITSAASSAEFLVTWKAQTYVPDGYEGKALATGKSRVFIAFELIDKGKPVNLAGQTVYWYLNDQLIQNTPGMQHIIVRAPEPPIEFLTILVTLPNYNGGSLSKTITIPVVPPDVVIESRYPNNKVSAQHIVLRGTPYFFNIDVHDLSFTWRANETELVDPKNPTRLEINLGSFPRETTTLPIKLTIKNRFTNFETATKEISLTLTQ